ncbi:hypothetical protein Pla52o_57270 [Novipirellula galeiformis]|uniref:Uncharacterized protein n=1 Tax=Novipirellula galeiformis TaxID=2528004 RepID=A0A5C6BE05_9BACT|nr:hypothetical protein [Novipirellula galeiformis]TWU10353.1 hypothetical protein Pla52o_57270 [Novipirellula galeiformis]
MKRKRLLSLSLATAASCLAIFVVVYASVERPTPINPLLTAVTKVTLGSTADQADAAMGMPPISVTETNGYLMSPMVMLASENELAPKDKVEPFSLRKYASDAHYAVVAVRPDGRVAGKWAGSIPNER